MLRGFIQFLNVDLCWPVTLFAGRIPLRFKKRLGAGHFHYVGPTLPIPSIKIKYIFITKSVYKFYNNTLQADLSLLVKHFCYFIFLSFIKKFLKISVFS